MDFTVPDEYIIALFVADFAAMIVAGYPVMGTKNFRMAEKPLKNDRIIV